MKTRREVLAECVAREINSRTNDPNANLIATVLAYVPGDRLPSESQDFDGVVKLAETNPTLAVNIINQDVIARDAEAKSQLGLRLSKIIG